MSQEGFNEVRRSGPIFKQKTIDEIIKVLEKIDQDPRMRELVNARHEFPKAGLGNNARIYLKAPVEQVFGFFRDNPDYTEKEYDYELEGGKTIKMSHFTHTPSGSEVQAYPPLPWGFLEQDFGRIYPGYNVTLIVYPKSARFLLDLCNLIRKSKIPNYIPEYKVLPPH